MITVLTGTPGNGKTAHAIDLCWFQQGSMWYPLQKYADGIGGLKCEHFEFPDLKELKAPAYVPVAQVDDDKYAVHLPENPFYQEFLNAKATAKTSMELWFLWATPGSVLVIDEAQRYFRPRPAGSPVPLYIQLLEYHRHYGIHLLLITQKERLIHSNVRALAGQHIHLTDGWRGRHRFEWPEIKDSDSKSEKAVSAHKDYKLPKHVFPFYQSSVQHLSVSHKKPLYAYALVAAVILFPVLMYAAYAHFKSRVDAPLPSANAAGLIGGVAVPASGVQAASSVAGVDTLYDFKPVVPGRPETAPAFNRLRQVVVMPVVSACIQSEQHCACYTQQGSRVADMSEETCRFRVEQGQQFNPYQVPVQTVQNAPASVYSGMGEGQSAPSMQRPPMRPVTAFDMANNK